MFRNDDSYTITSNFSLTKGAHELRFGLEGIRHHLNHWQPEIGGGPRGSFSFGQGVTGLRGGTPTNQLNGWATFLLGLPSSLGKSNQFIKMTTYEYQWGWYFRDRWQVGRNLTVSLGIRHELYPMMTRAGYGGIEAWDSNTNLVHLGGIAGNPRDPGDRHEQEAARSTRRRRVASEQVHRGPNGLRHHLQPHGPVAPVAGLLPVDARPDF